MLGNGSISRRSGQPSWAMLAAFSVGAFFFLLLVSPISAEDGGDRIPPLGPVSSEEGENLTTPATPIRQFVWKVRNWMYHRNDKDVNIEVDAEATSEPTDAERAQESKSWVRSVAAWFARGIRHLLERLNPPENGTGTDGSNNGTEEVQTPDGTNGSQDAATKRTNHVFRPWTALPPPPPPGMTASPDPSSTDSSAARTDSTPVYTKPPSTIAGKTISDSTGRKFSTAGSKATSDAATSSSAKKPKRRRPKPTSTISTMTTTPDMPPMLPMTTEEIFIQDTGNEI